MDLIIDCSSSPETHHSAADVLQNAHFKSTWTQSWIGAHLWQPIIPLRTSCKMPMLCPHGSHHRLQFISGNLSFRCGRPSKCSFQSLHGSNHGLEFISGNLSLRWGRRAKCLCCVHMDPIIDCSSSLETYHSAADVVQDAHAVSTWISS